MIIRSEHPRVIANSLLRIKRNRIDISQCISKDKKIVIYGCGALGKEVFWEVGGKEKVVAFIDRAFSGLFYEGIPCYSLDSDELFSILNDEHTVVIVTPMTFWKEIYNNIRKQFTKVEIMPVYGLFALAENDLKTKKGELLQKIVNREKTDIKRIGIFATVYSFLLYSLINPDFRKTIFLFSEAFPKDVLDRMDIESDYVFGGDRFSQDSDRVIDIANLLSIYAEKYQIEIWGQDHILIARTFPKEAFHVIEDGIANYSKNKANLNTTILDDGSLYIPMGYDKRTKEVYLTGKLPLPRNVCAPIVKINPKKMWHNTKIEDKKRIFDLFGYPYQKLSEIDSKNCVILLTEPLIRDHNFTDKEQIDLIKKILHRYEGKRVIIKPHPADRIEYERLFKGCYVLRERFPFELFIWDENVICKKYIAITEKNIKQNFLYNLVSRKMVDYYDFYGNCIE